MLVIRLLQLLLAAILLSGCSFFFDVQDSVQPDPKPDSRQQKIIHDAVQKITQTMKQAGASEISEIGPNEAQSGPEKWTVCTRASFSGSVRYFTYFVKGETIVNWRSAVINDNCEMRKFTPFAR